MKKLALTVTIFILVALMATHIVTISLVSASPGPDQGTLRPNAGGTYQEWETLVDTSHFAATSDQTDTTYIETVGASSNRDIQNLKDPIFPDTATINWVQVFIRAYAIGSPAPEKLTILERQNTSERNSAKTAITRGSWNEYSGVQNATAPDGGGWTKAKVAALQAGVEVDTMADGETLRVSEIWVVVDYTTDWESYSDSGHTIVENSFADTTNHVYMYGENFDAGDTTVCYYDGDNLLKEWDYTLGWGGGTLDWSECWLMGFAGPPPTAAAGDWHAVVIARGPDGLPGTHGEATADPDFVADDIFNVDATAIPEFPVVMAAIGVAGLCFGIYYWMRKRRLRAVVRIQ